MTRTDGRSAQQLRPMSSEQGLLHRADGSARFQHGQTSVMVAIFGPHEAKFAQKVVDRTQIEVVFKPVDGLPGPREHFLEALLRQALEAVVLGTLYPRTVLRVVIQVLRDDGCLLAAAVNGTCLALLDAGVDLRKLIIGCSCIVLEDGTLVVDPLLAEESAGTECLVNAAFEVGGKDNELVISNTSGVLVDKEKYMECIALCRRGARSVATFLKLSLEKKCAVERQIESV